MKLADATSSSCAAGVASTWVIDRFGVGHKNGFSALSFTAGTAAKDDSEVGGSNFRPKEDSNSDLPRRLAAALPPAPDSR